MIINNVIINKDSTTLIKTVNDSLLESINAHNCIIRGGDLVVKLNETLAVTVKHSVLKKYEGKAGHILSVFRDGREHKLFKYFQGGKVLFSLSKEFAIENELYTKFFRENPGFSFEEKDYQFVKFAKNLSIQVAA